jgi:NAD(P)H-hydrate epimerase
MERILSVMQMKNADDFTINKLGISSEELVLRAGSVVANEILSRFRGGRVLVCLGKGNNGADGKVIAEILSKKHGFYVNTLNVANGIFKLFEKDYDIIVDCIFGTGLNKNVEGKYFQAIDFINKSGAFVVSCDIPSGLNGDTGLAMGIAVKANLTVAIQEFKLGHFLNDGPDYSGETIVKDIGISIWGDDYYKRLNSEDIKQFFKKRARNVNKGDFGKASIVGGSKLFPGSSILSLNALLAYKMGLGYSNIAIPECIFSAVSLISPECTVQALKSAENNILYNEEDLFKLLKFNAIAFGMGAGITEDNYKIIEYLFKNYTGRLVIDADGLNTIAKFGVDILKNKKCEVVLTPHIKEFSRLIGKTVEEINDNLIEISKRFAKEFSVVLCLKSATSIITDGDNVYINTSGCNALAKGGSGDVLDGILVGLLAREVEDVIFTTAAASYLLGVCGEYATKKQNEFCVTASDVIREIPNVINDL